MPARMPEAYIAKPPVPLSQLVEGKTGFIYFTSVSVEAKDLSTYVSKAARNSE